jgi:hypothetical protein
MVSFTRFARAASPSTDRGTEKGQLDKRFSSLFTLPAQPPNPASPPTDENEKTSAETNTESAMNPASNPTRVKIDRRFSTLFMSAPQPSHPSTPPPHDETPWTFPPKPTPTPSQRKNLKLLFRRVFRSSTSSSTRDETNTPCTSEEIGSRLWADLMGDPSVGTTLPPPSSTTKQRSQTTVVVLPSLRNAPNKSTKGGVEIVGILQSSGSKRSDSKFSSITSLPSLHSLSLPTSNCSREGGTINVSSEGLLMLESCVRRIGRGLARQGISFPFSVHLPLLFPSTFYRFPPPWKRGREKEEETNEDGCTDANAKQNTSPPTSPKTSSPSSQKRQPKSRSRARVVSLPPPNTPSSLPSRKSKTLLGRLFFGKRFSCNAHRKSPPKSIKS